MDDLRELEREALQLQRIGDYKLAAKRWQQILEVNDKWEHGYAHYCLANCCATLGMLDEAAAHYRRAISVGPGDQLFIDGLNSLLDGRTRGLI